jgi:hypothetical protein
MEKVKTFIKDCVIVKVTAAFEDCKPLLQGSLIHMLVFDLNM